MTQCELEKIIFSLVIISISVHGAVITVPPVSVTVPPFTMATFTCEGNGNLLNWLVQSAELTESIEQQREIAVNTTDDGNNFSSVLTVKALPINIDLTVGCEIITYNPFHRVISNSQLTIRGISPVENLYFNFSQNNLLTIIWSQPVFFSDDVPIGSSISYQIQLIVGEGSIENTITTSANTFEVYNITQCDVFKVSVSAHVGQYTSSNETKKNYGNCSIEAQKVFQTFNDVIITIKLKCSPLLCSKSVLVEASCDGNVSYFEQIQLLKEGSNEIDSLTMNYSATALLPFKHYQIVFNLLSLTMSHEDEDIEIISTFNVQDLVLSSEGYKNGSVSVQCVFVTGSTADGCQVIFTHIGTERNESFNITGPNAIVSLLSSGNYTVTGYDISNKSIYGPAVYYPTLVEVVDLIIPTLDLVQSSSLALTSSMNVIITGTKEIDQQSRSVLIHLETIIPIPTESNNIAQLWYIISLGVGAFVIFVLIILTLAIASFCIGQKKRNEATKEVLNFNPAYGQVLQRSNIKSDVNPAYETTTSRNLKKHINADYETVFPQ